MKRRYKVTASVILGCLVVLIGVAVYVNRNHSKLVADSTTNVAITASTNLSKVEITVQPSQQGHVIQQKQLYATIQQMLQTNSSKSLDASGFIQYAFGTVGVNLPRTIAEQSQVGRIINNPNQLERGDLVFFDLDGNGGTPNFDGIYLGEGEIAAVTTHGLMQISLGDAYWTGKLAYGRRIF
jgi:cell wall-associated NlpC family hydrolase